MLNDMLKPSTTKYAVLVAAGLCLGAVPTANADGLGLGIGIGGGPGGEGSEGGLGIGAGAGIGGNGSGGLGIGAGLGIGSKGKGGLGVGAGVGLGQSDSAVSAGAGVATSHGIDSQTTAGVTVGNLDPGNLNATVDVNTGLAGQLQGQIGTGLQVGPLGLDLGVNINQGDTTTGTDPDGPVGDGPVGSMVSSLSSQERKQLIRRCTLIMQNPGRYTQMQVTVCQLAM